MPPSFKDGDATKFRESYFLLDCIRARNNLAVQNAASMTLMMLIPVNKPNVPPIIKSNESQMVYTISIN